MVDFEQWGAGQEWGRVACVRASFNAISTSGLRQLAGKAN
jgi:hypothetical protein